MNRHLIIYIAFALCLFAGVTESHAQATKQARAEKSFKTEAAYEEEISNLFKQGKWEQGKKLIESVWDSYGSVSGMSELAGWYWVHKKNYDKARYYLSRSLKDDKSNVHARQLMILVEEETKHWSAAISHINQQLLYMPYNKTLWLKKIQCYRNLKNDAEADLLLARLARIYPDDEKIKQNLAYREEERLLDLRKNGTMQEKEEALRKLVELHPSSVDWCLALVNNLIQQGKMNEAADVAGAGVTKFHGNPTLVRKKVGILVEQDNLQAALAYARSCMKTYKMSSLKKLCDELEEDAANQAYNNDPYVMYGRLYSRTHSLETLQRLVNMSMTRNYYDDALYYINEMQLKKGRTADLVYKEYTINKRIGNTNKANHLLVELYDLDPRNEEAAVYVERLAKLRRDSILLAEAEQAHRDSVAKAVWQFEEAERLLSAKQYELALVKIDSALMFSPKDVDMLELRDRIREKIYDAYIVNSIYVEYQQSRQGASDAIQGNATIQYTRKEDNDVWTGTLNYAGRDAVGDDPETLAIDGTSGGVGVQAIVGLERRLNDTITVVGQVGLANKIFPTILLKGAIIRDLKNDWRAGLQGSYRLVEKQSLFTVGLLGEKTLGQHLAFDGGIDGYLLFQRVAKYPAGVTSEYLQQHPEVNGIKENHTRVYVNANARVRYTPVLDNKSQIYGGFSIGNAPSTVLLDRALPNTFSHLSTSVGMGGTYVINTNLSIGVSGFWYTYYITQYRNYFYSNVYLTVRF